MIEIKQGISHVIGYVIANRNDPNRKYHFAKPPDDLEDLMKRYHYRYIRLDAICNSGIEIAMDKDYKNMNLEKRRRNLCSNCVAKLCKEGTDPLKIRWNGKHFFE